MDGQNYVIFHNDGNDSYMNTTANFRGADVGALFIDVYFKAAAVGNAGTSAGYDKVRLTVTTAYEEVALEMLAGIMAGSGPKGKVTVIADDKNSKYAVDHVTAVASITLSATGTFKAVESITPSGDGTGATGDANTKQLETYDSGKTFFINCGTNTAAFRLPAVSGSAGVTYRFIFDVSSDNEATKDFILSSDANDENIMGVMLDAGAVNDGVITTSVVKIDSSDGTISGGDRLEVICDGTNWYITNAETLTAAMWTVADNAI
jgi:hypothetical protein